MVRSNKRSQRPRGARRGGNQRKGQGAGRGNRASPPEFVSTLSLGHRFRFVAVSAFSRLSITRAMLLNLYTMATTTTNQFRLISGIKLNRISMWGQPAALGSTATPLLVEWLGQYSPSTIHSDTPIGVRPAYVRTRPPIDAAERWWTLSGNNETETLARLSGSAGTVIDVEVSIRLSDDESAAAGENGTGAASAVGTVYWNYLDGFASKMLAPTGGVTVLP